jgi:hypothetical protein
MTESHTNTKAHKTDAGNGSYGICRVSNALHSPSPIPSSMYTEMSSPYSEDLPDVLQESDPPRNRFSKAFVRRRFLGGFGLVSAGTVGGFIFGRVSPRPSARGAKLDGSAIFQQCVKSVVVIRIHANNSLGAGFCLDRFLLEGKDTCFVATADHVTEMNEISGSTGISVG